MFFMLLLLDPPQQTFCHSEKHIIKNRFTDYPRNMSTFNFSQEFIYLWLIISNSQQSLCLAITIAIQGNIIKQKGKSYIILATRTPPRRNSLTVLQKQHSFAYSGQKRRICQIRLFSNRIE